ncbi:hypothetical protein K435DRAFT_742898 [Dendrothele bispora CBS 962.96]|uniref:Uncharacterized protein n=1 Tax=Dendrothele bispora (strain CBS 962.96) TaxID=1314807 RepID=A0A4S8MV62_DENBC|nr:hypothetical protein K435DRAFT_742898 [Dendrothele bispora CBS 962.96]
MTSEYDYESNTYIAVTLDSASPFYASPSTLSEIHPALKHVGQVGKLEDVQLVSFMKEEWKNSLEEILGAIKSADGVKRLSVQEVKDLTKRNEEP